MIKMTDKKMKKKEKSKEEKDKITRYMTFSEILDKNPDVANILFESGLHCLGCAMSMNETIEEGLLAHGFSEKEIDNLIKKLNRKEK